MNHLSQFPVENPLARKVVIGLAILLGVVSALLAGFCFYVMDSAGLLAYSGFLLFSGLLVTSLGAILIYLREGQGLR